MLKALAIIAVLGVTALPAAPVLADDRDDYLAQQCAAVLDRQPRIVRKEAVTAIGPGAHVSVHPLCMGIGMFTFGNAAGLGKTIAANPVLAHALARYGLRGDDVTGIVINGNSVALYVHRDV